jgi:hypothetical protein
MYLLLPFTGALLALVFYLVLIAGLFAGAPGPDAKVAGFAAIAGLVGMFSTPAAEKLQEIFETVFTKRPQGKDTVRPVAVGSAPTVTKVTATAASDGLQRLVVEGTDFSEPLTATLNDGSGATKGLSARNVTTTQFEADVALSSGTWTILVATKDGKSSTPLQFTVQS